MKNSQANKRTYRHVPFSMLLYIAWRNMMHKKLRTSLTIIGIVIGVASVFFLLSFGLGLRELVAKEILGSESVRSISVETPNSKLLQLNSESPTRISGLPHVDQLSTTFTYPGAISYDSSEIEGIVYGIDNQYQNMTTLNLIQGELLNDDEPSTALLNSSALKSMGISDSQSVIGKKIGLKIPLKNQDASKEELKGEYVIVGIVDSGAGTEVFIPKRNFELLGMQTYSEIKLLADDTAQVTQLRSQIESLGFQTASPMDTVEQVNEVFRFFTIILLGFGMVGMVVAVLGMFNTLTISLIERTKEIGLMVALGGRPKDMRKLFIIEATLLSLIGSIAGVVVASLLALILNVVLFQVAQARGVVDYFNLFVMPWWLIIATVALMVVIGLLVVYFPAKRAQRIKPIDALRRE